MGFSKRESVLLDKFRKFSLTIAAIFLCGFFTTGAHAGDVANSSDSPNVTGATSGVLPQTFTSSESGLLQGLHVSGFLSQTFGMWQNPTALRDYTPSRNNLAVSRTWLQADENYQLDQNNSFFMREWFVYEPPYSFNSANGLGMYGNEFYNQYTVRDAW